MAIVISQPGGDELSAAINTTPLVDVMLVLLIIFLITIPVVTQTVPVSLPKESNVSRQTRPDHVELTIDRQGRIHWNAQPIDAAALTQRLSRLAGTAPQPEVHIRGDAQARYEFVGRVVLACQNAGISVINFVTEPPVRE